MLQLLKKIKFSKRISDRIDLTDKSLMDLAHNQQLRQGLVPNNKARNNIWREYA